MCHQISAALKKKKSTSHVLVSTVKDEQGVCARERVS
jgi:hypothetical protein